MEVMLILLPKGLCLAQSSRNPSDDEYGLVHLTDYYVFNKALSSNTAIDSVATLSGASTKGFILQTEERYYQMVLKALL